MPPNQKMIQEAHFPPLVGKFTIKTVIGASAASACALDDTTQGRPRSYNFKRY